MAWDSVELLSRLFYYEKLLEIEWENRYPEMMVIRDYEREHQHILEFDEV